MQQGLVKRMTAKDIHLAVKRPDGTEYLMKRFSFETVTDLEDAIRHVSPSFADEAIKALRKKHGKLSISEEVTVKMVLPPVEEEKSSTAEAYSVAFVLTDAVEMVTDDCEEEKDVKQDMVISVTLEEAKQYERELSDNVCALEGKHKALASQRHDYLVRIGEVRREVRSLREQQRAREEEMEQIIMAYNECHEEMVQINLEKAFQVELLKEARDRRVALEKVTVLVFADGSVSVENAELPVIDEEALVEEFNRLRVLPTVPEDFTFKTVKNLARLHLIMEALGGNAEIMFDTPALQPFWEDVVIAA